ncbi:UNVERIFIED_CONTAM: Beta-hexosaminidase 1 [Sesamum latifolium]|uniref:Beta-hexosaminidase 1 n=1 Tax=Sesamum latifolium TaxID=2727402 RepID=A0AAW2TAR0_9LAMI
MSLTACSSNPRSHLLLLVVLHLFCASLLVSSRNLERQRHLQLNDGDGPYIWPLPWQYTSGNETLTVDPNLSLVTSGNGGGSLIVSEAFDRYKRMIFEHASSVSHSAGVDYDLTKLNVVVHSGNEELQLGVDESYTLMVATSDKLSIVGQITIESGTWDAFSITLCQQYRLYLQEDVPRISS